MDIISSRVLILYMVRGLWKITFLSIHVWHCGPFWALASLKSCLHSSVSPACLLYPQIHGVCTAYFWTVSSHTVLGFPNGTVLWNFPLRIFFFGIQWLWISLFHLGCQCCVYYIGPYILNIFLSDASSICSVICVRVNLTFKIFFYVKWQNSGCMNLALSWNAVTSELFDLGLWSVVQR